MRVGEDSDKSGIISRDSASRGTNWEAEPFASFRAERTENGERRHDVPLFPESSKYESLIQQSARAHRIAPDLIRAVIRVESNFNAHALSPAGAEGLMQLMPKTAEALGVLDRREARENIAAGSRYLSQLLQRFHGDLVLTLAAYHAGPTRVERLGRIPAISSTRLYISKVMFHYYQYADRRAQGVITTNGLASAE